MVAFMLMEQSDVKIHIIHSLADDRIPFCEYFIIPYVLWYFFLIGTVIYFALSSYKKINTVNLKACADNELCQRKNAEEGYIEPLTQRELEAFYDKFTYGSNSKMKIHFSRSD